MIAAPDHLSVGRDPKFPRLGKQYSVGCRNVFTPRWPSDRVVRHEWRGFGIPIPAGSHQ